jgi:hypothetical protein
MRAAASRKPGIEVASRRRQFPVLGPPDKPYKHPLMSDSHAEDLFERQRDGAAPLLRPRREPLDPAPDSARVEALLAAPAAPAGPGLRRIALHGTGRGVRAAGPDLSNPQAQRNGGPMLRRIRIGMLPQRARRDGGRLVRR